MELHIIACGIKIIHMTVLVHDDGIKPRIYRFIAFINSLTLHLEARQIQPQIVCIQSELN
ncbi:hypothetical protein D3C75_444060 [compost metagenome]